MTLTLACPSDLMEDANALVAALGESVADLATFRGANWRDAGGGRYGAVSFEGAAAWLASAQGGLERPAWDSARQINLAGARRAQAALVCWVAGAAGDVPQASPARLVVIGGMPGLAALAAMGLAPVEGFALP